MSKFNEKCTSLNQLNNLKEIRELVMKLPFDMRKQFRTRMADRMKNNQTIDFAAFVEYVSRQTEIMKLPMLGNIKDRFSSSNHKTGNSKSFSIVSQTICDELKCVYCSKTNHSLDKCYFFTKNSIPERDIFIRTNNLCFGCLMSTVHISRDCSNSATCFECKRSHPTCLHKPVPVVYTSTSRRESSAGRSSSQGASAGGRSDRSSSGRASPPNGAAFNTKSGGSECKVVCPAVPISIKFNNSDKIINTYMGLDSFATASYIDDSILMRLEYDSFRFKLLFTTMENVCSKVDVNVLNNLQVHSLDGSRSFVIDRVHPKCNWLFDIHNSPVYSSDQVVAKPIT